MVLKEQYFELKVVTEKYGCDPQSVKDILVKFTNDILEEIDESWRLEHLSKEGSMIGRFRIRQHRFFGGDKPDEGSFGGKLTDPAGPSKSFSIGLEQSEGFFDVEGSFGGKQTDFAGPSKSFSIGLEWSENNLPSYENNEVSPLYENEHNVQNLNNEVSPSNENNNNVPNQNLPPSPRRSSRLRSKLKVDYGALTSTNRRVANPSTRKGRSTRNVSKGKSSVERPTGMSSKRVRKTRSKNNENVLPLEIQSVGEPFEYSKQYENPDLDEGSSLNRDGLEIQSVDEPFQNSPQLDNASIDGHKDTDSSIYHDEDGPDVREEKMKRYLRAQLFRHEIIGQVAINVIMEFFPTENKKLRADHFCKLVLSIINEKFYETNDDDWDYISVCNALKMCYFHGWPLSLVWDDELLLKADVEGSPASLHIQKLDTMRK